jgi:hypothetical protein
VLLGLVACLASVSGSFSPPLLGTAARERIEARLGRELGAPVALESVRVETLAAGLVVRGLRIPLESWRLDVPRLVIRPRLAPLLRGQLQLAASADGFALVGAEEGGAALAQRLPELLDALGLPDAGVSLRGGELRDRDGRVLLAPLAVALDVEGDDARLAVRARQRSGGRLDLQGTIRRGGTIRVNVYLDDLATNDVGPWLAALRGPGVGALELALERASVSGRWHASAGARGAVAHEFALDVRAAERIPGGRRGRAHTSLHLAGRFGLEARASARGPRAIAEGTELVVSGRAEQLRGRFAAAGSEALRGFLLSGPFEVAVRPAGSTARASLTARARLDDARLHALGLRKPAGEPAWLEVVAETAEGAFDRLAVTGAVGGLALEAELGREGQLDARTDWIELAALAALVPELRGRAAGGRARVANLRVRAGDDWTALVELDGAELAGARMPFEVRGLRGEARLGPDRLEARDCEAEIAGVPLRFDLDALRGGPGPAARVRFAARIESIAWDDVSPLAAAALPGRDGGGRGPSELAALGRLAEAPLRVLRELDLARRLEIERGRLRVAHLRAGSERFRDLEIDLALRGTLLELRRVAYLRGEQRSTWGGSIDLRGVVPDVELAALR